MFAVIESGSKQYLVHEGDTVQVEKLEAAEGDTITFDKVLLVASDDGATMNIGTPYLNGTSIEGTVAAQGRNKKVRVVKYKNKTRYKRTIGHRQHVTSVKIGSIA
jgi:large subunit ribosomal protein L21